MSTTTMTPTTINEQILDTLRYFDVQNHPLTLLEIHKYLLKQAGPERERLHGDAQQPGQVSVLEIAQALAGMQGSAGGGFSLVGSKNGFYFLAGREELADFRLKNNFYAAPRLKRAKKFLPHVRHIPFVSAVAMTGSEAINNSKQGSDIDLLVLTVKNRMWLGRLMLTLFFQAFGVRRHGARVAGRFCLNHYIEAGKHLYRDRNIYTAIEYVSLIPFFGGDKIYDFQLNNLDWLGDFLAQPVLVEYKTPQPSGFKRAIEFVFANRLGDFLEKLAGKAQSGRIHTRETIVVESNELSFHPGSKGRQVLQRYFGRQSKAE